MVDLDHPANRGILTHLGNPDRLGRSVSVAKSKPSCAPADVELPGYQLGTHPDLLARLWDELGGMLPVDCRWIVHGTPVLVHPESGVVLGFCGGTLTYALRLPHTACAAALASDAKTRWTYPAYPALGIAASVLDLADVGEEWVFGAWDAREVDWCEAAYQAAGSLGSRRT